MERASRGAPGRVKDFAVAVSVGLERPPPASGVDPFFRRMGN